MLEVLVPKWIYLETGREAGNIHGTYTPLLTGNTA